MAYTEEEAKRVEENLKLVHVVLKKYYFNTQYEYDDLFQIGCIGLMKAVRNWEPSRGVFSTFACKCINNDIIMHLRATKHTLLIENISVSLGTQINTEGEFVPLRQMISDNISVEDEIVLRQLKEDVNKIAKGISERAEYIARRVLMEDATQVKVAEELGISRTSVHNILKNITFEIRKLYT